MCGQGAPEIPCGRWREQEEGASIKGVKQELVQLRVDAKGQQLGVDRHDRPKNLVSTNLLMWLENYEHDRGLACKIKEENGQKKVVIGVPPNDVSCSITSNH